MNLLIQLRLFCILMICSQGLIILEEKKMLLLKTNRTLQKSSEYVSEFGTKSFLEAVTAEGLILGLLDSKKMKNTPTLYGLDLHLAAYCLLKNT